MRARIVLPCLLLASCAGGTLGRAEFVEQADALCKDARRLLTEGLRTPSPTPATDEQARRERALETAVRVNQQTEASLRALRVADELRGARDQLAALLGTATTELALALEAARREDEKAFEAGSQRAAEATSAFQRYAGTLRMKICAGEQEPR